MLFVYSFGTVHLFNVFIHTITKLHVVHNGSNKYITRRRTTTAVKQLQAPGAFNSHADAVIAEPIQMQLLLPPGVDPQHSPRKERRDLDRPEVMSRGRGRPPPEGAGRSWSGRRSGRSGWSPKGALFAQNEETGQSR